MSKDVMPCFSNRCLDIKKERDDKIPAELLAYCCLISYDWQHAHGIIIDREGNNVKISE